jgi:hypothetical protein
MKHEMIKTTSPAHTMEYQAGGLDRRSISGWAECNV